MHFIAPRPQDLAELMDAYLDASRRILHSDLHPVIAAAVVAYPFVFPPSVLRRKRPTASLPDPLRAGLQAVRPRRRGIPHLGHDAAPPAGLRRQPGIFLSSPCYP
jgi:hypothetical protein